MPLQINRLFYVSAHTPDGESLDLLVVATDKEQATRHWQEHYELTDATPAWVGAVPGVTPDASCEQGPIDWDAIKMD